MSITTDFYRIAIKNNIRLFNVDKDTSNLFCANSSNNLLIFDKEFKEIEHADKSKYFDFFKWKRYFHIAGGTSFFNLDSLEDKDLQILPTKKNDFLSLIAKNNNDFLFKVVNEELETVSYYHYSNLSQKAFGLCPEIQNPKTLIGNKVLCRNNNNLLSCHNILSGKEIWSLNFNKLLVDANLKLQGNIIIFINKIFINLIDFEGNKSANFVLNSQTGKVIHKCDLFGGYLRVLEDNKLYAINYRLGTRKKIGGGVNDYLRNVLFIIDATTLEETYIDLSETLDALDIKDENGKIEKYFRIKTDTFVVSNNYLYCHADGDSRIAVVDLVENKLVWSTTIQVENYPYPYIKELQVHDNRLFILDAGGTLHIYEYPKTELETKLV